MNQQVETAAAYRMSPLTVLFRNSLRFLKNNNFSSSNVNTGTKARIIIEIKLKDQNTLFHWWVNKGGLD